VSEVVNPHQGQLAAFRAMLAEVLAGNVFYRRKLDEVGITEAGTIEGWDDFLRLPFTHKQELVADQQANPPFGSFLTYPLERYTRLHQTSGTTGRPLRWLDTDESWAWWGRCWATVYRAAGVGAGDRIFFPFSFGPFVGFWAAWEGARQIGALAISGGAQSSEQRLASLLELGATVVCCTPSYALHLAEVARACGQAERLQGSAVRVLIVAGEPGGSLPATRQRIEAAWGARLYDHPGATEVGAYGFTCQQQVGVHLNEDEFIFEVLVPGSDCSAPDGDGELVITNLGRWGSPVIRYRTGDHVRLVQEPCTCGCRFARLEGGVLGRIDDMLIVRGVNVYPSAIENLVRTVPEIDEYCLVVRREGALDELTILIEPVVTDSAGAQALAEQLERLCDDRLALRTSVLSVARGTLPRWELKSHRVRDLREKGG
jgi:phenylacetate-CoA ligase